MEVSHGFNQSVFVSLNFIILWGKRNKWHGTDLDEKLSQMLHCDSFNNLIRSTATTLK